MERYAHEENFRRFEHEIRRETDPEKRAMLEQLLIAERLHLGRCRLEPGSMR